MKANPNNESGYFKSRVCVATILVVAFVVASVFRSQGLFIHEIYRIQELIGGDHATHFCMGVTFMGAALLVDLPRSVRQLIRVLFVVLLLLCLEEFSQLVTPAREFSGMDLTMGFFGALVMILGPVVWFLAFRPN